MRQAHTDDEPHLAVRTLSLDLARGAVLPPHRHPWPQLLYASSGTLRATLDGEIWLVPPRRALVLPPACPHRLDALGEVRLRTLYLRPDATTERQRVRVIEVSALLHELVLRACARQWLDARDRAEGLMAELLVLELHQAEGSDVHLRLPTDRRALALAQGMLDGSVVQLAPGLHAAGLSRRTAERLFAEQTGQSPARWLRLARLAQALERLMAGASIETAALAAGYTSRSAFSDQCLQVFGATPGALRAKAADA